MIAADTNILVHSHRADSRWHQAALSAVSSLANGRASWGIPWPCLAEFLAIVTHPRIFKTPTPLHQAQRAVDAWLASPSLVLLSEGPGFWQQYRQLISTAQVAGPRVHDARVAALCVYHGVTQLWTADRDFSRFPALQTANPLIG